MCWKDHRKLIIIMREQSHVKSYSSIKKIEDFENTFSQNRAKLQQKFHPV